MGLDSGTATTVVGTHPNFVRRNDRSVMPNRVCFLDTEAHRAITSVGETQSFRLAVVRFDRRRDSEAGWCESRYEAYHDLNVLWSRIDAFTHAKARTVMVCHNLGYDLLIANGLSYLPKLGWHVESCNIETNRAWMVWKRESRTLVLTDFMSWVSHSLTKVAKMIGLTKQELPGWDDSDDIWVRRCKTDVQILGDAWHVLMQWCEENDCGMWRPTGAGMSWSAFRHKFYTKGIQHHNREDLYELEREAAWTGRCEAWRHGKLTGGPFTEWDMTLAYANIGKECRVPIAPMGSIDRPSLSAALNYSRQFSVLTQCTVTTDVPVVPTKYNDHICWPTGTFETTLWDNELKLAVENGANVEVHRVEVYRNAPILREWGTWITDLLEEGKGEPNPLVRAMLKSWARTVIGRFGLKYSTWENWGECPLSNTLAFTLYDVEQPKGQKCISIGNDTLVEVGEAEARDSIPCVMSWIMAECRVRLWRTMTALGLEHVVYCDTDSVWVDPIGSKLLRSQLGGDWRPKQSWQNVEIYGPRQLVLSGEIKASGIPYRARKSEGTSWEAEVWSSPITQLAKGITDSVSIRLVRGKLRSPDYRRVHRPENKTDAIRIESVFADRSNRRAG